MHIKANGITFNYQIDGAQHAPWLIFSNSLATNLSMWDDQTRVLSGSFRILRYDQRGHGKTEAPEGRYPFAILLADAIALMDAFEIRSAAFCGLSLGGATALGLAEQYPDRIDRVIVCDSPCASTPTSAKQWEERILMDCYCKNPILGCRDRSRVISDIRTGFGFKANALEAAPTDSDLRTISSLLFNADRGSLQRKVQRPRRR